MRDLTQPTTAVTFRNWLPDGRVVAALALAVCTSVAFADPVPDNRPQAQVGVSEDLPAVAVRTVGLLSSPQGLGPLLAASALVPGEIGPERQVFSEDERSQIGAGTLFLTGFPGGGEAFRQLGVLTYGENQRFWTFFDSDVVRKIPPWALEFVKDNTGMTQEIADQEQDAYYDMLIFANRTSPAALDRAATPGDEALWAQVFRDPANYRGDVLHFEGKLKKLRRFDPQPMAVQGGVKDYYEGYVYIDAQEEVPVFFVFTELPPGLTPNDHLDVRVGFSGYFFKKFRYTAVDTKTTKKDRLAPLLIGRTITLLGVPAPAAPEKEADPAWPVWLGPLFFGVVGLTGILLFMIGYWFRSGDRRVRVRVSAARYGEFIPPPPEAPDDKKKSPERPGPHNRLPEGPGDLPKSEGERPA